jgi:hypothetical protein
MQAGRIAAEYGRLAVACDAIGAVGDARPAGAAHDPIAAAGQLLGFDAGERRPLERALPERYSEPETATDKEQRAPWPLAIVETVRQ